MSFLEYARFAQSEEGGRFTIYAKRIRTSDPTLRRSTNWYICVPDRYLQP